MDMVSIGSMRKTHLWELFLKTHAVKRVLEIKPSLRMMPVGVHQFEPTSIRKKFLPALTPCSTLSVSLS